MGKGSRVEFSKDKVILEQPGSVTQMGWSSPPQGPGCKPKTLAAAPRTSNAAVARAGGGGGGNGRGFFTLALASA